MSPLVTAAALLGIAGTSVICGTDVFSALVLSPAASRSTDASVAELMGRIHEYGDRRLPVPGIAAILAAAATVGFAQSSTTRAAAGVALVALGGWLVVYLSISAPVNKQLRAAALSHTVPADTRALQRRWDSVIWFRAGLQAVALGGLLIALISD
ncbi:MAG TPA: hypothetical protein VMK42_03115 [Anaeromyxobacteraceae bacterium]|nr:hypothetical protein [Anaeromyxobacteraceae bacterium]